MKRGALSLVLLGVVAGVGLILYGLLGTRPRPANPATEVSAAENVASFIIAARPIVHGQTIAAGDLASTRVVGSPPPGALRTAGEALGRIAVGDIAAGQFVPATLVSSDPGSAGLAVRVPPGRRAVSLSVTEEIGVAGFVRPGDHVDVQTVLRDDVITRREMSSRRSGDASETRTVLSNLEVLAVDDRQSALPPATGAKGQGDQAAPGQPNRQRTVTLAMTPQEVGQFGLARSLGPYFLALRNPKDNDAPFVENRAQLIDIRGDRHLGPARAQAATPRSGAGPRPIQLQVGGQTQFVYPEAAR